MDRVKNIVRGLLYPNSPHPLFRHNISYPVGYFKSLKRSSSLMKGDVVCILCTWDEERMISLALESSKDFVSRYIVVDKNGSTIPKIRECIDRWNLSTDIYVKPELGLRESRGFALTKVEDEDWILVQDGDEVFHTDGPSAISTLRQYMNRPNVVYCARLVNLVDTFHTTIEKCPVLDPHPFLYHNNGTVRLHPNSKGDQFTARSWLIGLPLIYKFNCAIKSHIRQVYRSKGREWHDTDTDLLLKEYVDAKYNVSKEVPKWNLVKYDESKWGQYPDLVRREIGVDRL